MDTSVARPFAVFDIDGTLIRWQLYHAVADELARQGHFGAIEYQKVRDARMTWKKRAGEDAFHDYEQTLVNLVDMVIGTISVEELQAACRQVISEYKDQVYTYTRSLISELKSRGYLLFAISASQDEIVGLLADYYGFDDFGGSHYEVKAGRFTGVKNVLRQGRKPELLKELVTKHAASFAGSIAVGDSESDIPMLASVERPIAFNPTKQLFMHAQAHGWQVVIERKNMVYELRQADGSYLLAQTNAG